MHFVQRNKKSGRFWSCYFCCTKLLVTRLFAPYISHKELEGSEAINPRMRCTIVFLLTLLAVGVNAHFQLQFPPPRGVFDEDKEPTFCGA